MEKGYQDWKLANQIISGKLTLEEALQKVSPNKKQTRNMLAKVFQKVRTGKMRKGYKNGAVNALDMIAGRQSDLTPDDPGYMYRRQFGMENPPLHKGQEESICGTCGISYLAKSKESTQCPNCEANFKSVSWHKGDLE